MKPHSIFIVAAFTLFMLFIPTRAAGPYYVVTLTYDATTEIATLRFAVPKSDASYYSTRFGAEGLRKEFQELVLLKVRDRIEAEKDNDWKRWRQYATEAMKAELEQIETEAKAAVIDP